MKSIRNIENELLSVSHWLKENFFSLQLLTIYTFLICRIVYLCDFMENSLIKYFVADESDSISITELENYSSLHPADIIPKLLLSKKMKQNNAHELMLQFNDRTAVHYMSSGSAIPSIRDLRTFLDKGSKSDFYQSSTISNDLDVRSGTTEAEQQEKMVIEAEVLNEYEHLIESDLQNEEFSTPSEKSETNLIGTLMTGDDQDVSTFIMEPANEVTDNTVSELSEVDDSEDFEIESGHLGTPKGKKSAKKKVKKSKKNKYTLREFSGISPFSKWLLTFKKADIDKKIEKEEKVAKRKAIEASANKSIKKSSQIISEPLADLLASQGHFDEAKKMYEQLMMKYPEKSSYFAAKINQNIKY
jgi:hypothetical protein